MDTNTLIFIICWVVGFLIMEIHFLITNKIWFVLDLNDVDEPESDFSFFLSSNLLIILIWTLIMFLLSGCYAIFILIAKSLSLDKVITMAMSIRILALGLLVKYGLWKIYKHRHLK